MILMTHILTGAAIGSTVANPILGALLAFLSHYILDALPHKEYSIENILDANWKKSLWDFSKVFLDFGLGIGILSYFVFMAHLSPFILVLGFTGALSDGLTFLNLLLPKNKILVKLCKFHDSCHYPKQQVQKNPLFVRGLEFIIILTATLFLFQIV